MLEVAGPTLTLRLPAPEHAAGLFVLGRDPEVTRWFSWGPYVSEDEPRRWIDGAAGRRASGTLLELVIERDGSPLGVTSLMELSRRDRRAMIGTWLGREHWGTGVNAEAKALVLHLAFETIGLARVGAYSEIRHERSQRALEKLGFRREGVLRAWHRHAGRPHDVVVFGLLHEEWRSDVPVAVAGELPSAYVL
ncbi:MAG: family N-acetyltransferase [Solirubrobacteraceae bacterium]|nr:family N-acetyltransferase [Solirubrobacteraceae bacterium]